VNTALVYGYWAMFREFIFKHFLHDNLFLVFQLWYMASKTLAEEAAWKFVKEKGIDMVTINPGFVIGPLLQPTLKSTAELFLDRINGMLNLSYVTCFPFKFINTSSNI
jgi:nucleoside-diphosphate-sugar epimerase